MMEWVNEIHGCSTVDDYVFTIQAQFEIEININEIKKILDDKNILCIN